MKRVLLLALSVPLLSIAILAQTPSSSTTPTQNNNQASPSPSPSPIAASRGIPNLPAVVEGLASGVMLLSVFGVLWIVLRRTQMGLSSIGPRHIQFVSVCLIVPTILILGLEKVLTSETSATLIGGLAGYLLSGLGRYEPPKRDDDRDKGKDKNPDATSGKPSPVDQSDLKSSESRYDKVARPYSPELDRTR